MVCYFCTIGQSKKADRYFAGSIPTPLRHGWVKFTAEFDDERIVKIDVIAWWAGVRLHIFDLRALTSSWLFFSTRHYTASYHSTSLKIVSSWPTSAADHCDRLMSWRVPQEEHVRVSETGVFPSLDRVSGTLCLLHYVTETSHLYSLRDFWRHLSRASAHSDCCFFCAV